MTYPEEAHKEVTAQNWPITFLIMLRSWSCPSFWPIWSALDAATHSRSWEGSRCVWNTEGHEEQLGLQKGVTTQGDPSGLSSLSTWVRSMSFSSLWGPLTLGTFNRNFPREKTCRNFIVKWLDTVYSPYHSSSSEINWPMMYYYVFLLWNVPRNDLNRLYLSSSNSQENEFFFCYIFGCWVYFEFHRGPGYFFLLSWF